METILITIGIFITIFVLKFIYDTYITKNTDRNFEEYRKIDPVGAAEIDPPKTHQEFENLVNALGKERKANDAGFIKAQNILAEQWNCSPQELRKEHFNDLKRSKYNSFAIHSFISQFENEMKIESEKYNLLPEYTPAAILKSLTQEYISMSQKDFYIRRSVELSAQGKSTSEIQKIIQDEIEDYPNKEKILRELLLRDQPAELLRLEAIDSMYDDNDYRWALVLVNRALDLNDPKVESNLHALKAEILLKTEEEKNRKK